MLAIGDMLLLNDLKIGYVRALDNARNEPPDSALAGNAVYR